MGSAEDRPGAGLRERKKVRTRRALLEAAYRLFEEKGFTATTTPEIAAAADVSATTFFNYFATKEELVLTQEGPRLLAVALEVLREPERGESAARLLRRALERMADAAEQGERAPTDELEAVRIRLLVSEPALWSGFLGRVFEAQERLAEALHRGCPDEVDALDSAVLVGAAIGAALAAGRTAVVTGVPLGDAVRRAVTVSLGFDHDERG